LESSTCPHGFSACSSRFFFFALNIQLSAKDSEILPPPGAPLPAAARTELEAGVKALGDDLATLRTELSAKPDRQALLPDIEIFHNAVRFALEDNLFYENAKSKKIDDVEHAKKLLQLGSARAKDLRAGLMPWLLQTGPVVRGYRSKLDGTAIPYGIVVPESFAKETLRPRRLDIWLHGRDDTLSELKFVYGRLAGKSEFLPADTFVLHPYGRYCNSYKIGGEMDVLEALAHAQTQYKIDPARIVMRGFSMGGAGAWHLGARYADKWVAVNPGAGFVDVANYQHIDEKDIHYPPYERKLWHWFDALGIAPNLLNTTLVAYSGEIDAQKAGADLMEKALAAEGAKMTHIIGPNTGHKYEPGAQKKVAELVDQAATTGRDPLPKEVRLVTYTLKQDTMKWVRLDALEAHWERASIVASRNDSFSDFSVETKNVAAFEFNFAGTKAKLPATVTLSIDGQQVVATPAQNGLSFVRNSVKKWEQGTLGEGLHKRHDLQGPIDDAFMSAFILVRPTGKALNTASGKFGNDEFEHARSSWRKQMRGEPVVKNDTEISVDDMKDHNLILFGDSSSNALIGKVLPQLPLKWTTASFELKGKTYDAAQFAPVLIFPNPLAPGHYIVLNSGFTFADVRGSNAQQTPKASRLGCD